MDTLPLWAWGAFLLFIAIMLALDLGVFQRQSHEVGMKEALVWCAAWLALALGCNGLVWTWLGAKPALAFFTGYLVELCLSVDNIFVFIVIFAYFQVPPRYQHRVLFWGILGAVVMRALFIAAGLGLLARFHWIIWLFGAFLIFTGIRMALPKKKEMDPGKNPAVRLFRRFFPVSDAYDGGRFFTVRDGRRLATPLFIVLLVIETTDVAFALDSIPAVLAITRDAFIVFTSNIFAVLGLRSLYFLLAGVMKLFRFLGLGLAAILVFIGVKMLVSSYYDLSIGLSLGVIAGVLAVSVLASVLIKASETAGKS